MAKEKKKLRIKSPVNSPFQDFGKTNTICNTRTVLVLGPPRITGLGGILQTLHERTCYMGEVAEPFLNSELILSHPTALEESTSNI